MAVSTVNRDRHTTRVATQTTGNWYGDDDDNRDVESGENYPILPKERRAEIRREDAETKNGIIKFGQQTVTKGAFLADDALGKLTKASSQLSGKNINLDIHDIGAYINPLIVESNEKTGNEIISRLLKLENQEGQNAINVLRNLYLVAKCESNARMQEGRLSVTPSELNDWAEGKNLEGISSKELRDFWAGIYSEHSNEIKLINKTAKESGFKNVGELMRRPLHEKLGGGNNRWLTMGFFMAPQAVSFLLGNLMGTAYQSGNQGLAHLAYIGSTIASAIVPMLIGNYTRHWASSKSKFAPIIILFTLLSHNLAPLLEIFRAIFCFKSAIGAKEPNWFENILEKFSEALSLLGWASMGGFALSHWERAKSPELKGNAPSAVYGRRMQYFGWAVNLIGMLAHMYASVQSLNLRSQGTQLNKEYEKAAMPVQALIEKEGERIGDLLKAGKITEKQANEIFEKFIEVQLQKYPELAELEAKQNKLSRDEKLLRVIQTIAMTGVGLQMMSQGTQNVIWQSSGLMDQNSKLSIFGAVMQFLKNQSGGKYNLQFAGNLIQTIGGPLLFAGMTFSDIMSTLFGTDALFYSPQNPISKWTEKNLGFTKNPLYQIGTSGLFL